MLETSPERPRRTTSSRLCSVCHMVKLEPHRRLCKLCWTVGLIIRIGESTIRTYGRLTRRKK